MSTPSPSTSGAPGGWPGALPGDEQVGLASWYGLPYHGRRAASGEVYDMNDLTAAHQTLPFGARVLVVNRETEASVEVRINDRGPFVDGRIIDLSYAAARAIGVVGPGVIPVRLRLVSLAPPPSVLGKDDPGRGVGMAGGVPPPTFAVQVGAFVEPERAERLREAVARDLGQSGAVILPAVLGGETVYRVRIGPYPDREAARAAARRLAEHGFPGIVVER